MKTRTFKDDKWWKAEYRDWFRLLWIIPIFPVWVTFSYWFGDDYLLGLAPTDHTFNTEEEAQVFIDKQLQILE